MSLAFGKILTNIFLLLHFCFYLKADFFQEQRCLAVDYYLSLPNFSDATATIKKSMRIISFRYNLHLNFVIHMFLFVNFSAEYQLMN